MGVRVLYLVRHGQYVLDPDHPSAGNLTALGRRQAQRTARRLASVHFDHVYHSDLPRAVQTANFIHARLNGIPCQSLRALRELMPPLARNSGVLGRTRQDAEEFRAAVPALRKRLLTVPRGERDRTDLVVAHGNLIRYLVRVALDEPVRRWIRFSTNHCGITILVLRRRPRLSYLKSYNDLGHLPFVMQTES